MKKIVTIIALMVFLKPVFPVIDYVVNYNYITTVLCVNKAKPKLQCNGKCHLMKQMAKMAESEKPISSDKKAITQDTETLFVYQSNDYLPKVFFALILKITPFSVNFYSFLNQSSVFRPPINYTIF